MYLLFVPTIRQSGSSLTQVDFQIQYNQEAELTFEEIIFQQTIIIQALKKTAMVAIVVNDNKLTIVNTAIFFLSKLNFEFGE